jgi:Electron transfer DM13
LAKLLSEMKNQTYWLVGLAWLFCLVAACTNRPELVEADQALPPNLDPNAPALATGNFVADAHPTSGTVRVLADSQNPAQRHLVFANLRTDAGPDLRVYLAENNRAGGFVEVARLDKTGNFTLPVPAGTDLAKKKFVLIWCQRFAVGFGHAELK